MATCGKCLRTPEFAIEAEGQDVEHIRAHYADPEGYLTYRLGEWEAEAKAEAEAERRAERFWEEGPHGPEDDPRERALWAYEDARREFFGW